MRAIVFGLLLAAGPVCADSIARSGSDWIRLSLNPCEGKAAEVIRAAGGDPLAFRAGYARISGQEFAACWQPVDGGALLVYDDGDQSVIPAAEFKRAPEA